MFRRIGITTAFMIAASLTYSAAVLGADASGSWSGSWKSCQSGHKGPLHATICQLDETRYQANFSGKFFLLIPFKYSVVLHVSKVEGDTITLSGSKHMSRRLGTFYYTATVTGDSFSARYSSAKDCGYFQMTRCCR